ncbi:MAG TPA: polymer-forming cytoskeletal protein [Terriglobales bacterium]|nr:polymer-forming cytoskeletal protein [Terriglobales bacterium]
MIVAPAMLFAATGVMLALPVTPALLELRRREDASAIPIQQHDGDIRNFAASFRRYIAPLLPALEECRRAHACETLPMQGANAAFLAGILEERGRMLLHEHGRAGALVLCAVPAATQPGSIFTGDLYVTDTLATGPGTVFRAVLSDRDILLGAAAKVMRWAHAEGSIYAAAGCEFFGRLSAEKAITLARGCRFERMRASRIVVARGEECPASAAIPFPRELPVMLGSAGRHRSHRVIEIFEGSRHRGDLISERAIRIGRRSHVSGSLKSHGDTDIGEGTVINGSAVSGRDLRIGSGCLLRGPIIAEGNVVVGAGAQVGSPSHPATISARRIELAAEACVYGSVWAREYGVTGE